MPSPSLNSNTATRAFPAHPRLDRYFASSASEAARRRIVQCLLRGDGPALLLGAPGVGKSMLIDVIANDVAGKLRVVRLASTQLCTRRALLQAILHGLDGPYRDREEGELRLSLADLLRDPAQTGAGVALLVDEAQTLPLRLLEELRLLSNIALDGVPRLRLVLAGAHNLDESFTDPSLEAFSQRIAARCYLEPLSRDELGQYVRAHIAAAGGDPDQVLEADAYEALAQASDGLPRLVNQVADRALTLAAERDDASIDRQAIGDAWSDLHRLAAPWQAPASTPLAVATSPGLTALTDSTLAAEDPGVEFGMLVDEAEALQAEAEAVTALTAEIAARGGVWDAGDKLLDFATPSDPPALEEEDEGPVAYAFPKVADTPTEEDLAAEASLADPTPEIEPYEIDDTPEAITAPATDSTHDPFEESFDEEEVLLDPYAEHERVIPAAPEVVSEELTDLEKAYRALDEIEALAAEPEPVLKPAGPNDTAAQAEDILVVEPDEQPNATAAYRQDYADLFANLRQG